MKKTERLFICCALLCGVVAIYVGLLNAHTGARVGKIPDTPYGSFLAAQHAIYINDFDAAAKYGANLDDASGAVVKNVKVLSDFLSGQLPAGAADLAKETGTTARLIYDAYLVGQGDWQKLYNRHKSDNSALVAPLRVWASVGINHRTEAIKFVESLETNESWKSFVRGQIYAETGNVEKAAAQFANVRVDFMNINDYMYIMSFYRHNDMTATADALRDEFTSRPGGMFMADFDNRKVPQLVAVASSLSVCSRLHQAENQPCPKSTDGCRNYSNLAWDKVFPNSN